MSTSETFTFDVGPSPCGVGRISKRVISQDNPWGTVDISYSIDCPACLRDWRINRNFLVLRSSETPFNLSLNAKMVARDALHQLLRSMVEHQFSDFSAPTKKAEHAELVRLGLTDMSYRQYLEHKRKGGNLYSAAAPLRNPAWVKAAARQMNVEKQLEHLTDADSKADQAKTQAAKQIVRITLA